MWDHRAVVWISLLEPSKEEVDSVARQFGWQSWRGRTPKPTRESGRSMRGVS